MRPGELRLATIRQLERVGQDQDFAIEGLAVLEKWRQDVGSDTTLRASHTLLPLESVTRVLRRHMLEFYERWKKRFPLKATDGQILFPYADYPRLIEFARAAVVEELAASRLAAAGLDTRYAFAPRKRIPADSWRAFNVIDFEHSLVSTGECSIRDVRVVRADVRMDA